MNHIAMNHIAMNHRAARPSRTGPLRHAARALIATALVTGAAAAFAPTAQAAPTATTPDRASSSASSASAAASGPVSARAARSTAVSLKNSTGTMLFRSWTNLDHGCWTNGQLPPESVSRWTTRSWQSESCGMMTGTEGEAKYSLGGGELVVRWNNPYIGSNSYSCSAPGGYHCGWTGGSGNNAQVAFEVWAAGKSAGKTAGKPVADGPVSAQAARSTRVTFNNHSGKGLLRKNAALQWGIWSGNQFPGEDLGPGTSTSWQSESDGFMTGTEGTVTYDMVGVGPVRVHWNNPYWGSNSYSCSAPGGYQCSWTGGSGNNTEVNFTDRKSVV